MLKYKLNSKLKRAKISKIWFMNNQIPKALKFQNKYKIKWKMRIKCPKIILEKVYYSFPSKVHYNLLNKAYYNPLGKVKRIHRTKVQNKVTKRWKKWRRE